MMEFPSMEWALALQKVCNADNRFQKASLWSDLKVVFAIGSQRYWFKLYRGKIIDVMEYLPMSNPLGYDVIVSGAVEAWEKIVSKHKVLWQLVLSGEILIDGNMLEANRMTEAICIIADEAMNRVG